MTSFQLFKSLSGIDGELLARVEAQKPPKRLPRKRLWLIAAAVVLALALVGCAAYAWHWYTTYFTMLREAPLSDSQISYIEQNAEDLSESQTYDGYTVRLVSTLSDQGRAYVTFQIIAPEDVDLNFAFGDEDLLFDYTFAGPAETKLPANESFRFVEDGDGKKNTLHFVLEIDPTSGILKEEGGDTSFGARHPWRIVLKNLKKIGYDREYEQELLRTKYAGQEAYMLESDEAARIHPETLLAEGRWEFIVEFEATDRQTLELLSAPITTKAVVSRKNRTDSMFYDKQDFIEDITVTSVQLHSLGATVTLVPPESKEGTDFPDYLCAWLDMGDTYNPLTQLVTGEENFFVILKDGTRIDFFQATGAADTAELTADSPIVLEKVDYLQLSDGTRLYPEV